LSYGYVTPSTGFTAEVWFKRDVLPSDVQTLLNQRTQASVNWGVSVAIQIQGRQFVLYMDTTGTLHFNAYNETATSGTSVAAWFDPSPSGYGNDNAWHHLALTVSSNKLNWYIYLDGALLGSGVFSVALNWNPGVFTFGAQYAPHLGNYGSYLWDKWLAYPALYNKQLSGNRIAEHYTAGSGGTVYYGDNEVTRMTRISDWAEIPEVSREFDDALVTLQGIQVSGTNALTAFQDASEAASGLVFADGQSRLVYHNRRRRYNKWSVVTLAESLGSAPEVGMTFTIDDANIYNDIRGDRPYGSTVRIQNALSKAAHGRKTFSFSIPVTTHDELRNAVSWISAQYGFPKVRVSEVMFRAESSTVIEWMATGGIQIGDHITLDELPQDAAPQAKMELVVEKVGLEVDIKNRIWGLRLQLSPYEINQVFKVGTSTLGNTYRIAY
jgi:hypothetical protein